jgi:hypothetical protein
VLRESVGRQVGAEVTATGDTTAAVEELITILESSGPGFEKTEDLIYGYTPMRAAMRVVAERLTRELRQFPDILRPIIVVISGGQSTDGDPTEVFREIRNAGATLIYWCRGARVSVGSGHVSGAAGRAGVEGPCTHGSIRTRPASAK